MDTSITAFFMMVILMWKVTEFRGKKGSRVESNNVIGKKKM